MGRADPPDLLLGTLDLPILPHRQPRVVGMIAAHAAGPLAAGLVEAQMLGHLLDRYLLGVSPRDPAAFAAVLVVLAVTASAAMWIPARRALRLDPAVTLRAE